MIERATAHHQVPFFAMVVAGAACFTAQFVLGIVLLTAWRDGSEAAGGDAANGGGDSGASGGSGTDESDDGIAGAGLLAQLALAAHEIATGYLALCLGVLAYFHTYLLAKGLSTFDWLRAERARFGALRAAAKAGEPLPAGVRAHADPWLLCIPCLFERCC